MTHLARISGVTKQQIGAVVGGQTHSNGTPRVLGDESCRALEVAMGRPVGWMDSDHSKAESVLESDVLDALRDCSPDDQAQILSLLNKLRRPKTSA